MESNGRRPRTFSGASIGQLGTGSVEATGEHFVVHAYSDSHAHRTLQLAESIYEDVISETGAENFTQSEPYHLFVFENLIELQDKSGLPSWATGGIVDGAIATYDDPTVIPAAVTHFTTHLIYGGLMGALDERTRWVGEGLATHLERRQSQRTAPPELQRYESSVPFREMTQLPPLDERNRKTNSWYRQVGNVVGYMLDRGGRLGFADFISALQSGASLDEAVGRGYPQLWHNMEELEKQWNENR